MCQTDLTSNLTFVVRDFIIETTYRKLRMITIINGDMIEQESLIKDDSIDLILTDPPYNISENGAKPVWINKETGKDKNSIHSQKFSESFSENWDAITHDEFLSQMDQWANIWFNKLKKGGSFAVFISDQYISYLWKIMENAGFEPKRIWTWKKPAAVPFNRSVNPVSGCEYILWGIKPGGKRTFNSDTSLNSRIDKFSMADKISSIIYKHTREDLGVKTLETIFEEALTEAKEVYASRKTTGDIIHAVVPNTITYSGGLGNRIHPTEKPVVVLEYFIELLSNKGDIVLDTFAGSGSCGVACNTLDRNCVLIERDKKMFTSMEERLFPENLQLFNINSEIISQH
jgi:DNA modification methylase